MKLIEVLKLDEQGRAKWLYEYGQLPNGTVGRDYVYPPTALIQKHIFKDNECWLSYQLRNLAVKKDDEKFEASLTAIHDLIFPSQEYRPVECMWVMLWAVKYITPFEIIIASLMVLEGEEKCLD